MTNEIKRNRQQKRESSQSDVMSKNEKKERTVHKIPIHITFLLFELISNT